MGQGADKGSMSSLGPTIGIQVGDGGTGQPETKQDGNPIPLKKSLQPEEERIEK